MSKDQEINSMKVNLGTMELTNEGLFNQITENTIQDDVKIDRKMCRLRDSARYERAKENNVTIWRRPHRNILFKRNISLNARK